MESSSPKKNRPGVKEDGICLYCGKVLGSERKWNRLYCDNVCQGKAKAEREKKRRAEKKKSKSRSLEKDNRQKTPKGVDPYFLRRGNSRVGRRGDIFGS